MRCSISGSLSTPVTSARTFSPGRRWFLSAIMNAIIQRASIALRCGCGLFVASLRRGKYASARRTTSRERLRQKPHIFRASSKPALSAQRVHGESAQASGQRLMEAETGSNDFTVGELAPASACVCTLFRQGEIARRPARRRKARARREEVSRTFSAQGGTRAIAQRQTRASQDGVPADARVGMRRRTGGSARP